MQDEGGVDVVTEEWIRGHGIRIPRAAGVFESATGWVRLNGSGIVVAAGQKDQTVLAWLVDEKVLDTAAVDYGIAYVTCRAAEKAYRKERGFKSSLDLSIIGAGHGLSCEQAAQVFCLVRCRLGREASKLVEYACDGIRSPDTRVNGPSFRKAFSALAKHFDAAIRDVREGRISDEPQRARKGLEKMLAYSINN